MRRFTASMVLAAAATTALTMFGSGVANATPDWVNAPGYVESISSGEEPGTLLYSEEVPTPSTVKVPARTYILTYEDGTGQITKQTLIIPDSYEGTRPMLTYVHPTDSLDPEMAPSRVLLKEPKSVDLSAPNEWLGRGGVVLIPDSYGDQNPTYAGVDNGVRIRNGILAAQSFLGRDIPTGCTGFSGGGVDCGRVAEATQVEVPNYRGTIIGGSPADMTAVVNDADGNIQSGLIMASAAPGLLRSLDPEHQAEVDAQVRPSVKLAFELLDLGGEGSSNSTLLGVFGLNPEWLFVEGGYDSPAVQRAFERASLGQNTPDAPVAVVGNTNDPWMKWDNNGAPLAQQYAEEGVDVTVQTVTTDGYFSHTMISPTDQVEIVDGWMPEDSKLAPAEETQLEQTPASPQTAAVNAAIAPVMGEVMNAVGEALESEIPKISATLNEVVPPALDVLDQVLSVPNPLFGAPATN